MEVRGFIANLLKKFPPLLSVPSNDKKVKPLLRVASYLVIKKLKKLITDISEGKKEISFLQEFLIEQAVLHQELETNYFRAPHLLMNQINKLVAKELALYLQNDSIQFGDLLMPAIFNAEQNVQYKNLLSTLPFHYFVLADDGVTLIHVADCLNKASDNATSVLYHTQNISETLSSDEALRIINHSRYTIAYYDDIKYIEKFKSLQSSEKFIPTAGKIDFNAAILTDNYIVNSCNDEVMEEKLIHYVCQNVQTLDELVDLMQNTLHPNEWRDFIRKIKKEELSRIVLENDIWLNVLQRKKNYNGDHLHDRIALFCLTEVYIHNRSDNKQENKNNESWFLKLPSLRYSWEVKRESAGVIQDFLMNNDGVVTSKNLIKFLEENKKTLLHQGPIFEWLSELAMIPMQMDAINTPDYFNEKEKGWFGVKLS